MSHAMITIVAPLPLEQLQAAKDAIDALGNPASDHIRNELGMLDDDGQGVHFMSLHALASGVAGKAHLVYEFSADGDASGALDMIANAIGPELQSVFSFASDWKPTSEIRRYLGIHQIKTGWGLWNDPGLAFTGTPGMTVGRIRAEAKLASDLTSQLGKQTAGMSALTRLRVIRKTFAPTSPFLLPSDPVQPFAEASIPSLVSAAIISFLRTFVWPFILLLFVWILWGGIAAGISAHEAQFGIWDCICAIGAGLWKGFWTGTLSFLAALIAVGGLFYARLRRKEESDWTSNRAPDRETARQIVLRENHSANNHMMSLTQIKPGWLRTFTVRLAFWAIGTLAGLLYKPGFLGQIGTIHFARWITIPGTRDFIFFSNYGGSWESYLEDFIELAHDGLTAVWSNTTGYPKTKNLFQDGATDGERFKRYARQSMEPTLFWYSAYPHLTTANIRRNAEIRRGFSSAMTEDDAMNWLSHFGSTNRPPEKFVGQEIQSLVFGGMGFMPYSACTLWNLPDNVRAAKAWLRDVAPYIAFNDGRRLRDDPDIKGAIQLGISSNGLARIGLAQEGLETFPLAFLEGMNNPGRARILGDVGANSAENWWWGRESADISIIIYAETLKDLKLLEKKLAAIASEHGAKLDHKVALEPIPQVKVQGQFFHTEPFGFADGISQPVMRGTYRGQRNGDPMHLVSPGEFILGYPDNRGNLPPSPYLSALHDPKNHLPVMDHDIDYSHNSANNMRDIGRNGSYLVIRQLEQDVEAFDTYCATESARLRTRLSPPYEMTPEFIGAKIVGRWKNGSPLVRAPYRTSNSEDIIRENSFEMGTEDPEALKCPFGSHVRRANPRDSLGPGSVEQIAINNRHRILRVGRRYQAEQGQKPGILFMCLNGDLERQFEFVQQTWCLSPNFMALSGETDPLLSNGEEGKNGYTIPTRDGPVKLNPMQQFVTMRGGGYYFLAGKRLIDHLSGKF